MRLFVTSAVSLILLALVNAAIAAGGETQGFAEVAVIGPLTTSSKSFGIPQLQGVTLAVNQYNSKTANIDRRRSVNIRIYDDQSRQQAAVDIISQIETSSAVTAIGPANSGVALALINKLQQDSSSLPLISPMATATELSGTADTWPSFLRANVSDRQRLKKLISTMFDNTKDPNNIVLVYEDHDSYGEGLRDDARSILDGMNFPSDRILLIPFGRNLKTSDATQIANNIVQKGAGSNADAILIFAITSDAISLISAINKNQIKSRIYFNEPDEIEFRTAAQRNVDLSHVQIVSVYYSKNFIVNRFERDFKRVFGEEPSKAAALSYDATNLILYAIDRVYDKRIFPNKGVEPFRKEVLNVLKSSEDKDVDFVVPGSHQFENGEFRHLQFFSLTYDKKGDILPVELKERVDPLEYKPSTASIIISSFWYISAIIFGIFILSYLGSFTRQYTAIPRLHLKRILFSSTTLLVDPLISLITLSACVIFIFVFKQDIFQLAKDSKYIVIVGSAVVASFSGYLGVKSITVITGRILPAERGGDQQIENKTRPN